MGQKRKKVEDVDEATGLGRITREQIEKWNQMAAQRFQTGRNIRNAQPREREREGGGVFLMPRLCVCAIVNHEFMSVKRETK